MSENRKSKKRKIQELLQDLLENSRIYRQKPPQPKYQITWDPSLVLDYLAKMYPLPEVSLPQLTCKLVTLLALVTDHRIHALTKIRTRNITRFSNRLEIKIPDLINVTG
ncbi:unnamed protein product [Acanthoscelides obtectus]|uniref:Uncharacterized protein n=1 Tax=Acanthoscelides obtectus TaxID=200917 RepID=A0A9P0KLH4_ACAOB|nr:unnamed protein product [Acanthoscelides obtectus]CAK1623649.1 hypothetical protein AOBTE_LOCUS2103 [Acanthoscelides obtectus]